MPTCQSYFTLQDIYFKLRHQTIFREDEIIISSCDQISDFAPEKKNRYDSFCLLRPFPPIPFCCPSPNQVKRQLLLSTFYIFPQ